MGDTSESTPAPLEGVRVIDLSMGWSGPLAARHLADMGAQVIKVEACQRFDWWRGWDASPEAIADGQIEKAPQFNMVNRNKLGITLDLASEKGVALLERLVAIADVVLENNAASVLPRLGLDYERLRRINPEIVMLSMPAFGSEGPWRDYRAYGSTVEQASGLPHLNGRPNDPPTMQHVAWGDPVAGLNGAAAILVALWHRRRTGTGQRVDLSQVECLLPLASHGLLEQSLNGRAFRRPGNGHPHHAPHGIYPCRGEDRWAAIMVTDDSAWQALCRVIGRTDLATEERLRTARGRKAAEARLDEAVAGWTRDHDRGVVMSRLQESGIAAAAVRSAGETLEDPHLGARGYWQRGEREFVGPSVHPSTPYRFGPDPIRVRGPSPTLGQHNVEVLTGLLRLDEAEIEKLEAERVIGTRPVAR